MPRTCSLNSKTFRRVGFGAPIKPDVWGMNLLLCIPNNLSSTRTLPNADVAPSYHRFHQWRQCRLLIFPENQKGKAFGSVFLIDPFRRIDESVHVPRMHREQRRSPARARKRSAKLHRPCCSMFVKPFCILHPIRLLEKKGLLVICSIL